MIILSSIFWLLAPAIFVAVCLFMMLVILIQKPKGGGLSGAFGGAGGSSQAVFGAKVGDVLTLVTVLSFVLFLVLAMGMAWKATHDHQTSSTKPDNAATQDIDQQEAEQEMPQDVQTQNAEQDNDQSESAEELSNELANSQSDESAEQVEETDTGIESEQAPAHGTEP